MEYSGKEFPGGEDAIKSILLVTAAAFGITTSCASDTPMIEPQSDKQDRDNGQDH